MKHIFRLFVFTATFFLGTGIVYAQTPPDNLYAIGASWNQSATPSVASTALYGRKVASNLNVTDTGAGTMVTVAYPTYLFTAMDILPIAKNPFTVSTNISAGVAQKVLTFYGVNVFMPTSAGVSITGTNTGWTWTGGALADYTIKKNGNLTHFHLMPNVRWVKSSVSNGAGYQLTAGMLLGWD